MKRMIAISLAVGMLGFNSTASASCKNIIKEHIDWVNSGRDNTVYLQYTAVKNKYEAIDYAYPKGYGSYFSGGTRTTSNQVYNLKLNGKMYFSDRDFFSRTRADDVEMTFKTDGTGSLKLITWGNTIKPMSNMVCTKDIYGAYITGKLDGGGTTRFSITLKKKYWYLG